MTNVTIHRRILGSNPVFTVSRDEVLKWLRSVADEHGFADFPLAAVQINVEHKFAFGEKYHLECPELVVMVSNVKREK